MHDREHKKITHLMVLLWNTILSVSMIGYTLSRGQGPMAAVLLTAGLIVSWSAHLTARLPANTRLSLHTFLLMLSFFYYGSHEESVFDLAPIIVGFILVYVTTEDVRFIRLCAAVYYLTILYDFAFLPEGTADIPFFRPDRIVIHFLIVFMCERVAEAIIYKSLKEKADTEEKISRLEDANRSAEDFLTNVSHELRTPINAVTGITAALLKQETDPEKQRQLISVQTAGNRLFDQVEDIMDYSEVDASRISVSEEPYSIPSLINDIIVENRLMERRLDVELIFDVDPKIPSMLLGDGRKIKKVINHLTTNAMKFTERGGAHVWIHAVPKPYGINLCIRVSDTGTGIAADELERITERFFQSNSGRNRNSGGLGLGLPIVYGMVTAMNGFVQVESAKGSGTVVSVSIPQKVADASPCMAVANRADLGLAVYLLPEKYEVPEVRDQYNHTISHMIRGLGLAVHRVFRLEELKRLVDSVELSHLFIGEAEYWEDAEYFEQLSRSLEVIVTAGEAFQTAEGSLIKIVRKPFYSLPVVKILNSQSVFEDDAADREILSCPDVSVLIVDDEPMNLQVAEGIFNAWNMDIKTAESGMKAIELCRSENFDMIFLDHMMPIMDGVETLKELRKLWAGADKKPTVIAFSANAVSGAREMFLREGFDEFIPKPIEARSLKRLLKRLLPDASIVYESENGTKKYAVKGQDILEGNGFKVAEGLQYCGNDAAFYEEILLRFAHDSDGRISRLDDALKESDMKAYQILAHTLKSSAKTAGAETLSELARLAEEAAKKADAEYLKEHHSELVNSCREAASSIVSALGRDETTEESAAGGAELTKNELLESLRSLRETFDTYESDRADSILAKISGAVYRGKPVSELTKALRQDIEDFEWDAAAEKTDALIGDLEDGEV